MYWFVWKFELQIIGDLWYLLSMSSCLIEKRYEEAGT